MAGKWVSRTINVAFIVVLLLLIFRPGAKGWVLKQLLNVGLFRADTSGVATIAMTPVDLKLVDSSGNYLNTSAFIGKTVFINFWASWCPPCRAEMPGIAALQQSLRSDTNVVFIFVNEDDDRSKAVNYLRDNDFHSGIFKLAESPALSVYSGTLPTTLVINRNAALIFKHEGIANFDTEKFKKWITSQ